MSKIHQSSQELANHLKEQVRFLKSSSASYDQGFDGEAKRLAVTVRVLLHDTKKSISLLNQLGKKFLFYDTCHEYDPANISTFHGLVLIQSSPRGQEYVPRFVIPPRPGLEYYYAHFDEWWSRTIIVDEKKSVFSRRDIVLTLADNEGGAHVDPALDESYAHLTRNGTMGWRSIRDGSIIKSIELASMRQIAYEVLFTLENQSPEYLR